jgi:spore maturation protein CgeB
MRTLDIGILGLSITSSWGNGHATTYRGLVRALAEQGHQVTFFERDVPWYASHRDDEVSSGSETILYASIDELKDRYAARIRAADFVIVGSYVPEGVEAGRWITSIRSRGNAFYDIDTPVTLAAIDRGDCEYLTRDLIPRYDLYLSFTGGPTLERLQSELGSPAARALYCSFDPSSYYPEERGLQWDLGYLGTWSADRQPALDELLIRPARREPGLKCFVAGPQYPETIDWPENVGRAEHIGPRDHRAFYCEQRFTLNVTRREMIRAGWSPSVRLFEAAACGTPIISDWWEGLDELLIPGSEIAICRSAGEVLSVLREMPEPDRREMARRARSRVLAEHSAERRAEQLVGHLVESVARRNGVAV